MKIAPKAARDFLQAPDKASIGTLLYGPDAGLVRERLHLITAKITGAANDPFGNVELSEDQLKSDPARLSDELAAMSLLGGRRLVSVRNASDKSAKIIEAALNAAGGEHYLVVCADELGPRSSLRQLFETHSGLAALACYKDEAADLQAVIRQRLDAAGIQCSREAMAYLQRHLGNDRQVTQSELDKIILYLGEERTLSLETAEALIEHNRDVTMDGINMELASGNMTALEPLITQALREGMPPVALLRAAQKHFQRLYQARDGVESGKPADQAMAALKPPVFFRYTQVFARQLQEWRLERLARALAALSRAEAECKQTGAAPALLISKAFTDIARLRSA